MGISDKTDLTLPGLVHDLNNVLQTLFEAAELLSTDPKWESLSAAITRSVERGKDLTARLQDRDFSGSVASFDSILDNAISFVEDSLIAGQGPRIEFVRQVERGLELERNWAWERVLINLFSNAVRAMPGGGAIYVKAAQSNRRINIVVSDEGPGIAPEILQDVFKPFVSTKASGGLGLHIVETIVQQSDGEVKAANRTDGRGAEFTISVPVEPQNAARARA